MSDEFDRNTLPDGATLMSDLPQEERPQDKSEPLTVGRLKEILKDVDDHLVVLADGCDCIEEAHWVYVDHAALQVEILRAGHNWNGRAVR